MYPYIHTDSRMFTMRPSSKQAAGYLLGEATGTEGSAHAIMKVPTLKGHSTLNLYNMLDLSGDTKRCTVCQQVQFRQFVNKVLWQEIDHVLVGLMLVRSHRDQRRTTWNKGEKLKLNHNSGVRPASTVQTVARQLNTQHKCDVDLRPSGAVTSVAASAALGEQTAIRVQHGPARGR